MKVWVDEDLGVSLVYRTEAECEAICFEREVPDELARLWLAATDEFLAMQQQIREFERCDSE